jgi:hypothetical protein
VLNVKEIQALARSSVLEPAKKSKVRESQLRRVSNFTKRVHPNLKCFTNPTERI